MLFFLIDQPFAYALSSSFAISPLPAAFAHNNAIEDRFYNTSVILHYEHYNETLTFDAPSLHSYIDQRLHAIFVPHHVKIAFVSSILWVRSKEDVLQMAHISYLFCENNTAYSVPHFNRKWVKIPC